MELVALPWMQPTPLRVPPDLARGLDAAALQQGLERLVADPEVRAVVAFGSRARGDGRPDSDLDLAVISALPKLEHAGKRAAYLAQSRWHVMGDVAREGQVLYVAG